jgi:hypothetical protein
MVKVELVAVLTIVIDPVVLPAEVGSRVTVNVTVCDGFRVAGAVMPLALYPTPRVVMLETFTSAFPELVKVIC